MIQRPDLLIFDPYLTTLGGGERFVLTVAEALRPMAGRLIVAAPELPSRRKLREFGLPDDFSFEQMATHGFTEASRNRDGIVYVTNTLPPSSLASVSYLIVQFPFRRLPSPLRYRARQRALRTLAAYRCIVYSEYCRYWLRRRWHQDAVVVTPPVELGNYKPESKKPLILSVARFFPAGRRQDVLVKAFSRLPRPIRERWNLVLAGAVGADAPSRRYLDKVKRAARLVGNVEVRVNLPRVEMENLYAEASLFWHATGYKRPIYAPDRAEQFGIATVEAMSYGAVPLVYADGGHPQIVHESGIVWRKIDELVHWTSELVTDGNRRHKYAARSSALSQRYDERRFLENITTLLSFNRTAGS